MRRKGGGSYYLRGEVYWVKYYKDGRPYRESTGSGFERDAKDLLNRRLGDIAAGRPLSPRADRIKIGELPDDLLVEYQVNERASLRRMKELVNHLRPAFGHFRAAAVTTVDVNRYIAARQAAGAANATINRELAALKRAYSIACKAAKVLARPHIPMLSENNVRTGFFERDQFEAIRAQLPPELHGVVTFAYITGWRVPSEILTLRWHQVDFEAGVVRLEPGTTKNREGRLFPVRGRASGGSGAAACDYGSRAAPDSSDYPVGIPSSGGADQIVLRRLADGMQGGWRAWSHPTRP